MNDQLQEILKIALGIAVPLVVFFLGYLAENVRNKIERKHKNRIQFEIEGRFLGPQAGYYILDLGVTLHNKGLVRLMIKELNLSVCGIKQKEDITAFEEYDKDGVINNIAKFPEEIVKANMLQTIEPGDEEKSYFVEPGVEQRFSYVARIPEDISFIFTRAYFDYSSNSKRKSKHSTQTIFETGKDYSMHHEK